MISFSVLCEENKSKLAAELCSELDGGDVEYVLEIAAQLSELDDGCEYALSAAAGCILIRVFDEEYFFLLPEPVADSADVICAVDEIRKYTLKEEIPLVISEVSEEYLDGILSLFKHAEAECDDPDIGCYTVRAFSELSLTEEPLFASAGGVTLSLLSDGDLLPYARLCRDREINKYWGYDYALDAPNADDEYFLRTSREELSRGTAASLAVRAEGCFIGEAVLYRFDLTGGCECAIRLLPEYQGRGYGTECCRALVALALSLGISRLYATVSKANTPSINLFSKFFEAADDGAENIVFICEM